MRNFQVFLSSPGDVAEERTIAHKILLTLPEEPAWEGKVGIHVVRWDNPHSPTPMYANYAPQEAVNRHLRKPSQCDLVVLMLWGRFGTPLAEPLKPDGSRYLSGTEWEYDDALKANVPVLLFRRTQEPQVSLRDKEADEKRRQLELVDRFFEQFVGENGALIGGFVPYSTVGEFETVFKAIIQRAIRQLLEPGGHVPSPSLQPIIDLLTQELAETKKQLFSLQQSFVLREVPPEPTAGAIHKSGEPEKRKGLLELPTTITVERTDLEGATTAATDPGVTIAPVMPVSLITTFPDAVPTVSGWGLAAVGANSSPYSGDGVVVAILGTGIDTQHEAFRGVTILERDFSGEGNGDQHGHGTHCAGTIFGRSVEDARISVAPGVKKALIAKVFGSVGTSTSATLLEAMQWVIAEGADVIMMSLLFDPFDLAEALQRKGLPKEVARSRSLSTYSANITLFGRFVDIVKAGAAFSRSPLIVAAAGDESQLDLDPNATANVSAPARVDGILSVAALRESTEGLEVAPFSNLGAVVSAPGCRIQSANVGGRLASLSGTSVAAAHVAGVAALWAEKIRRSGEKMDDLMLRLVATAVDVPRLPTAYRGARLVQAPQK